MSKLFLAENKFRPIDYAKASRSGDIKVVFVQELEGYNDGHSCSSAGTLGGACVDSRYAAYVSIGNVKFTMNMCDFIQLEKYFRAEIIDKRK